MTWHCRLPVPKVKTKGAAPNSYVKKQAHTLLLLIFLHFCRTYYEPTSNELHASSVSVLVDGETGALGEAPHSPRPVSTSPENQEVRALQDEVLAKMDAEQLLWQQISNKHPFPLEAVLSSAHACVLLRKAEAIAFEHSLELHRAISDTLQDIQQWVAGNPCLLVDKLQAHENELKKSKRARTRLELDVDEAEHNGNVTEASEKKEELQQERAKVQRLRNSVQELALELAALSEAHFPELCAPSNKLIFDLINHGGLLENHFSFEEYDGEPKLMPIDGARHLMYTAKLRGETVVLKEYEYLYSIGFCPC